MTKISNNKPVYDLEERTFQFAKAVRLFVKLLPKTTANIEDSKQVIKSSGSVGANYREANESLSKKDFLMRIKISRKESKESGYWLKLIHETNSLENADDAQSLIQKETATVPGIFVIPNSKHQIPNKSQIRNTNDQN